MHRLVNLIVHSHYSFLQSTLSLEKIVSFAVNNKCSYASLVDINVMYGAIEFYDLCLKNNLKPIIGLQVKYKDSEFVLIAKNYLGYQCLLKISSIIMTNNEQDWSSLVDENLFVIRLNGTYELTNHLYTLGNSNNSVAAKPVYYFDQEDTKLFKVLQAIKNEQILSYENLNNLDSDHQLLSPEQIKNSYTIEQITNLQTIVEHVDLVIPKNLSNNMLRFPNPDNIDSKQYLDNLVHTKLLNYLQKNPHLNKDVYLERINFELQIIHDKGFDDYFLVVQDFINYAKSNHIMVGPGRGSAAGSLVSFCLNITELDPVKYNLLFERFLNIERISMPDIDTDVMDTKRDMLIDYLFTKYGYNHVCHIITFARMKAKQAIRDVGRIFNVNLNIINKICKNIKSDFEHDLIDAINHPENFPKHTKSLDILREEFVHNKELFYFSQKLIGLPRQSGTHAAGIILSNDKLTNHVAVQSCLDKKIMCQTSMEYLEDLGLIKIDILGLRNLTIIDSILKLVKYTRNIDLDLQTINLEDKKVFKLFQDAQTNGIFQFESDGMKKVLKSIKPDSLEELALVSAIYRPGASDGIKLYLHNKTHVNELKFVNDEVAKILKPTYGVIVYQEQIIKLVQIIANFDKFKADSFRKAISKKKEDLVLSVKDEFITNAVKNHFSQQQAENEFNTMLKFASYGFNYSHALSYALVSYWLGYLKTYYPIESISVFLTYGDVDPDKMMSYIYEAKQLGIEISGPNINLSNTSFVLQRNKIIFSLTSIPNLGVETAKKIIDLRNKQPQNRFIDANKTIAKLSNLGVSRTVLEYLIKVGSFDGLNKNRDYLLANLDLLSDKKINILNINDSFVFELPLKEDIAYQPNSYSEYEKEVLGINFSLSVLDQLFIKYQHQYQLEHCATNTLFEFNVLIQIVQITSKISKNNKPYWVVDFIENNLSYSATIFDNLEHLVSELTIGSLWIIKLKSPEKSKHYNVIKLIKKVNINE